MSSMRFNGRLGTYHHGQQHPFKDAGVVADRLTRLTGIHDAMKCFLFVNRNYVHTLSYYST
jgi:hypothetical protein